MIVRGAAFEARRCRRKESMEGAMSPTIGGMTTTRTGASVSERSFAMYENNTLYKRCATSGSAYREVFPQVKG